METWVRKTIASNGFCSSHINPKEGKVFSSLNDISEETELYQYLILQRNPYSSLQELHDSFVSI
jgi:hypothetical protein